MRGSVSRARAMAMPLPLPAGEGHAPFANDGVVAVFEVQDELVGLGFVGGPDDVFAADLLPQPKGDVFGHGAGEEEDVLLDDGDLRTQAVQVPFTHIHTVNEDAAAIHIIRPVHQLGQRGLARAGLPDNGDGLPRFGLEGDIAQQIAAAVRVAEAHVFKHNLPLHGRTVPGHCHPVPSRL
jgi:hypothetical protein